MYIHTTVPVGKEKVVAVPYQSVLKLSGSNDRYLFLNEDGYAKRVSVEIGQRFNKYIEVFAEDVREGKEVVVQGQNGLIDGTKVQVLNTTYEEEAAAKSGVGTSLVPAEDEGVAIPVEEKSQVIDQKDLNKKK